jgi:DNA-directed RNA polymerase sigma subunit (sigma70/sigma32)
MESAVDLNCTVIASESGEHTLQSIGDRFGLTRMRICQLEKEILMNLKRLKTVRKSF